jgi:cobalt-zinc-cadmium efflux system outer membrane protein
LKKTNNLLEVASLNKTLAWSSLLPNLNFSYYKQALPESNNFYGVSFGISLPVWFFLDQRGQIQETSANYSIAQEEIKTAKKSVEINLKNAYSSFCYEQEQIKLYMNELLLQAEEVFKLARYSYNQGEINYVEFLQAKQTLISVNSNYLNSLSGYYTSLSSLEKAVSKLFR